MHLYQQSLAFTRMASSFIHEQNKCPVKARGFLSQYIMSFREVMKLDSSTEK